MSRVLSLLLAVVLVDLGQPTLAAPLPDELPAALPAMPPVAPLPMDNASQPQPKAVESDLPGSDTASADGEATTEDGLKIGNDSLRLRQDDPGPTRESPLRDPRLNSYAPRQPWSTARARWPGGSRLVLWSATLHGERRPFVRAVGFFPRRC